MYSVNIVMTTDVVVVSTHSCQHTQTLTVTLSATQKHHSCQHTQTHTYCNIDLAVCDHRLIYQELWKMEDEAVQT